MILLVFPFPEASSRLLSESRFEGDTPDETQT